MFLNNSCASSQREVCDLFSKYFGSVYNEDGIQSANVHDQPEGFDNSLILNSLSLTLEQVEKCLRGLDANKGPGPDGIPPSILKECCYGFKSPQTYLFNKSLSLGIFPECWKKSYLIPIFKSGRRNVIDNYRGIAILSAIPKLFELLVFNSIYFQLRTTTKQQYRYNNMVF
jgi:hypothetical protein